MNDIFGEDSRISQFRNFLDYIILYLQFGYAPIFLLWILKLCIHTHENFRYNGRSHNSFICFGDLSVFLCGELKLLTYSLGMNRVQNCESNFFFAIVLFTESG